jgi:exodeoxyribonuclease VII small subunit
VADFEKKLTDLETIVQKLEQGELPLEESVRLFEEGMKLSDDCKKELDTAEGRVQLLVDQGGGKLKAQPLDVEPDDEDFIVDDDEDEE